MPLDMTCPPFSYTCQAPFSGFIFLISGVASWVFVCLIISTDHSHEQPPGLRAYVCVTNNKYMTFASLHTCFI